MYINFKWFLMKTKIFGLLMLLSFVSVAQTKQQIEATIKNYFNAYGIFMLNGISQQMASSITFKNNVIEIMVTHSNYPNSISNLNVVVTSSMKIEKYTFNIDALKFKENEGLDFNILQYNDKGGEIVLYLNVSSAQKMSYSVIEGHHKDNLNKKYHAIKGQLPNKSNVTLYDDPNAWTKLGFTPTKYIRIPFKVASIAELNRVKNALNKQFVKYVNLNRDVIYKYNNKGITMSETYLLNKVRHGKRIFYHENGKIRLVELWENGKRIAFLNQFLKDGTQVLKNGNGTFMVFDTQGNRTFEAEYLNGKREGKATWYYSNGQILESVLYKSQMDNQSSLRWEILSSFHKNGEARDKGNLKEGNGTWVVYDKEGKVKKVLAFKNGLEIKK